MALVKYGGGIIQMSGSIAGNTFARNRYGNYVRSRTKPVNPNTASQAKARTIISELVVIWGDVLTALQRTSWNDYADSQPMKNKLGETIKLSGFNHFIRSNAARYQYHPSWLVKNGPTEFTLPNKDTLLTIDVDASPQRLEISFNNTLPWCSEFTGGLFMYQGRPQNDQRNFFAGPWHWWKGFHGTPAPTTPWGMAPYYPVAVGQKVWLRCRISREDGRLSEPWQVSALVHAHAPGEVPNLVGLTQPDAVEKLTVAELVLGEVTTDHDPVMPIDHIISSDPIANTRLEVGDPVNIVVSLGPIE